MNTRATTSLREAAELYLKSLEENGSSESTLSGYKAELRKALEVLGEETTLGDLTEEEVKKYFRSKRVTCKRDGTKRNTLTIDRSRRVLRLCLRHAEEQGLVDKAPVPKEE